MYNVIRVCVSLSCSTVRTCREISIAVKQKKKGSAATRRADTLRLLFLSSLLSSISTLINFSINIAKIAKPVYASNPKVVAIFFIRESLSESLKRIKPCARARQSIDIA